MNHSYYKAVVASLILLVASTNFAWSFTHGTANFFNGHHTQMNVPAGGAPGSPFLNFFKNVGRWSNVSAGGSFDVTKLDADGYPTVVPAGGAQVNINLPTSPNNYILLWDGTGVMGSSGSIVSGSYSTSGVKLSFGGGGFTNQIKVISVNSPSDYPHNIRLVMDNGTDPGLLAAGQIFRPDYIAYANKAGVIRVMDAVAGNTSTVTFWADRKPATYYTYNNYYFPPGKMVPAANVTYDGISNYTVTWSGQTGALTDKTSMIVQLPTTQTVFPSTLNLNGTGNFSLAIPSGVIRTGGQGISGGQWVFATFDQDLQVWMVDNSGGTLNTGIDVGTPPDVLIAEANVLGAHIWWTPGMYQMDTNNGVSDYPAGLATLAKATLLPGLLSIHELETNETWNFAFQQFNYAVYKQTVRNGGPTQNQSVAYTITGATSGATTTLTIGSNTTQVGSLVVIANVGGITGFGTGTNARVLSKPDATHIIVDTTTTGSYTSGGTATPQNFDVNNWVGFVASKHAQALAAVYGLGNRNITYKAIVAFQAFGGASVLSANVGTATRLTSPFLTVNGNPGQAASNWATDISAATYFEPSYVASGTQMTVIEGQLAFEYASANPARQVDILNQYSNSTTASTTPVTIIGITPGNPTVLSVDRTDLFSVSDSNGEVTTINGVTGNIGGTLNRSTYNSPAFTILSKTASTVTISVDTTGKTYSGGGTMTTKGSLGGSITNVYLNILPQFLLYTSSFSLGFMPYEGGQGQDRMSQDSSANIKGLTNGATTVLNVGANSWDNLYNTVGLTGMTTTISGIAAGTLATLLNGHTYTILSATPTTITINVDTSGVSSWISGGTASYVGSMNAVNAIRNGVNFTPAAETNTVTNDTNFVALCATCKFPSEYTMEGQQNYSMFFPDYIGQTLTPYRYNGMVDFNFLLKRDLDPASNDNSPMWLEKAA